MISEIAKIPEKENYQLPDPQGVKVTYYNSDKIVTHQTCNRCKKVKPIKEFNRNNNNLSGYRYSCKECEKVHGKLALMRRVHKIYFEKLLPLYVSGVEFTSFDIAQTLKISIDYARRLSNTMESMGLLQSRVQGQTKVYQTHIRCSLIQKDNIGEDLNTIQRQAKGCDITSTVKTIQKYLEDSTHDGQTEGNGCGGRY